MSLAAALNEPEPAAAKPKTGGGRPTIYKLTTGGRVPSVTTITGKFKDAGGLIHWAWQQGIDGLDYRQTQQQAATAGRIAHTWIEDTLHGKQPAKPEGVAPELVAQAEIGYRAFLAWKDRMGLQLVETETPMVSEQFRFGGTPDALATLATDKLPVLLDWKTSGGVYVDYLAQLAAYAQLYREKGVELGGAVLLRVGKEFGDFHAHEYPPLVLEMGWDYFEHLRRLYDLHADLKKAAA